MGGGTLHPGEENRLGEAGEEQGVVDIDHSSDPCIDQAVVSHDGIAELQFFSDVGAGQDGGIGDFRVFIEEAFPSDNGIGSHDSAPVNAAIGAKIARGKDPGGGMDFDVSFEPDALGIGTPRESGRDGGLIQEFPLAAQEVLEISENQQVLFGDTVVTDGLWEGVGQ